MITKEELHKLIDECDIVRLNRATLEVECGHCGEYTDIELYEMADFFQYCKAKS